MGWPKEKVLFFAAEKSHLVRIYEHKTPQCKTLVSHSFAEGLRVKPIPSAAKSGFTLCELLGERFRLSGWVFLGMMLFKKLKSIRSLQSFYCCKTSNATEQRDEMF